MDEETGTENVSHLDDGYANDNTERRGAIRWNRNLLPVNRRLRTTKS